MNKREIWRVRFGALLSTGLIAVALLLPAHAEDESSDDSPAASPLPKKGAKSLGPRNLPMPPGARGLPGLPPDGGPPMPRERIQEKAESSDDDSSSSASSKGKSSGSSAESAGADRQKPPSLSSSNTVNIDFVGIALSDLVRYMAEVMEMNFIIDEDLKGDVTIVSHKPISKALAYEAFLSALEVAGYTTVTVGKATKIVKTGDAANAPTRVYQGDNIPFTENYVTQIIELDNVSVSDVSSVVKELASRSAKVIAYSPTNTLILTDNANNIRRVYKVIKDLDVSAPLARLSVIPLIYADATEVEKIIEELYGSESASKTSDSSSSSRRSSSRSRRRSTSKNRDESSSTASATKVGDGQYISKVISDERTNSLIILANEEAMQKIRDVISELDRDVDPSSRSQIHVVYLEHAKAEDVATVLSNLSEQSSSSSSRNRGNSSRSSNTRTRGSRNGGPQSRSQDTSSEASTGVTAAFDSGVRVTSDENTNSLVIIASPEDFRVIKEVIDKLDVRRKQVFVECVIMEIASDETFDVGMGYHGGAPGEDGSLSLLSSQLNGYSLGLDSTDLLSGLAMGVFGEMVDVTVSDGAGGTTDLSVPSFGIALNALQSNSLVNILSTPNVLTLDNEEATISVGRNIPVPTSTSFDSNNNPIVSYQREDVGIELTVTPQINESNFVTLEVSQEVSEIEEDSSGLDVTSAGFITSKRAAETTVLVHDNQTIVLGGLIANTETVVETKIPVLGDIPLIGVLFRGKRETARKTNLLIVLTPHVISEPSDLEEVYQIKVAQRNEFLRRFYGKTPEEQQTEMRNLLQYSMNLVDQPSVYRTKLADEEGASSAADIDVEVGGDVPVVPSPIDDLDELDTLDGIEE